MALLVQNIALRNRINNWSASKKFNIETFIFQIHEKIINNFFVIKFKKNFEFFVSNFINKYYLCFTMTIIKFFSSKLILKLKIKTLLYRHYIVVWSDSYNIIHLQIYIKMWRQNHNFEIKVKRQYQPCHLSPITLMCNTLECEQCFYHCHLPFLT